MPSAHDLHRLLVLEAHQRQSDVGVPAGVFLGAAKVDLGAVVRHHREVDVPLLPLHALDGFDVREGELLAARGASAAGLEEPQPLLAEQAALFLPELQQPSAALLQHPLPQDLLGRRHGGCETLRPGGAARENGRVVRQAAFSSSSGFPGRTRKPALCRVSPGPAPRASLLAGSVATCPLQLAPRSFCFPLAFLSCSARASPQFCLPDGAHAQTRDCSAGSLEGSARRGSLPAAEAGRPIRAPTGVRGGSGKQPGGARKSPGWRDAFISQKAANAHGFERHRWHVARV